MTDAGEELTLGFESLSPDAGIYLFQKAVIFI